MFFLIARMYVEELKPLNAVVGGKDNDGGQNESSLDNRLQQPEQQSSEESGCEPPPVSIVLAPILAVLQVTFGRIADAGSAIEPIFFAGGLSVLVTVTVATLVDMKRTGRSRPTSVDESLRSAYWAIIGISALLSLGATLAEVIDPGFASWIGIVLTSLWVVLILYLAWVYIIDRRKSQKSGSSNERGA